MTDRAGGAGFELLEHTADVGVRARGPSLQAVFEQATRGLAEVLGAWRAGPGEPAEVAVGPADLGGVLVDWLQEVLWLHESRHAALAGVRVDRAGEDGAAGRVTLASPGGPFDGTPVKAVTYHQLRVAPDGAGWLAEVYLDV
jgi:SHS2 domain-containing protein